MSCTTSVLARRWDEPIAQGASLEYEVDLSWALARRWEEREWSLTDTIRAPNGLDAVCVQAGRSGPRPPPWSTTVGRRVNDGGVVWEMAAASGASLVTSVSEFTWDCPAGITDSAGFDSALSSARLLTVSADAEPGDYTITVNAQCANGTLRRQPCILTVVGVDE